MGGIKIFKKLLNAFGSEKFEDKFKDVKIVNGIIISEASQFKKNEDRELKEIKSKKKINTDNLKEEIFEEKNLLKVMENEVIENNLIYEDIEDKEIQELDLLRATRRGRVRDIEGFYISLQSGGRSILTIKTYRYALEWWEKVAKKNKTSIYNLKLKNIEEAIAELDINTKKKKISALKQLGKWYLREGFPYLNIETQKIMIGRGKSRIPKAKSQEDFKKIREHGQELIKAEKREGIWLLLMLTCGCRIGEIETVTAGDKFITVIGKGNKERKIPCSPELLKALKEFQAEGRGGYRKKRGVVDAILRKMGYTHLHTLRHTYATILHHNGLNLEEVSRLLGHADISTTQVYAQTKINEGVNKIFDEL